MRYVVGVLAIVVIAIFAVVLIGSHHSSPPKTSTTKQVLKLPDYADKNSKTMLTAQGPVVGEDQFQSIRITVSRDNRRVEILQGYEGNTVNSEQFANTQSAYDVFLRALNNANFNSKRASSFADERGVCALGDRYIYDLQNDNDQVVHTWSTSCGGEGTFAGKSSLVRQLFQNQIPDYGKFVSGVRL